MNQTNNTVEGHLIIKDKLDNFGEFKLQEMVKGTISDKSIELKGTSYVIIDAPRKSIDYKLDNWNGKIENENTIIGTSMDQLGINGNFALTRIID